MNSQFYAGVPQGFTGVLTTRWGEPVRVAGQAGELRVRSGTIWLTRLGDPDDQVLHAGQHLRLRPGDDALFEQWARGEPACIEWHPAARVLHNRRVPLREPA